MDEQPKSERVAKKISQKSLQRFWFLQNFLNFFHFSISSALENKKETKNNWAYIIKVSKRKTGDDKFSRMTSEKDKIIFKNSIVMLLLFTFTSKLLSIDFLSVISFINTHYWVTDKHATTTESTANKPMKIWTQKHICE